MINQLDDIILTLNIPEYKLKKGDLGLVLFVLDKGKSFMVEFTNLLGEKIALIKLFPSQVKKINKINTHHIRNFNLN